MFDKIKDVFNVFRYGQQVANPALWKAGGNAASVLTPLIIYAAKLLGDFGYGIQMSNEEAGAISAGVVSLVMLIINNVSSRKAGLLPAKQPTFTELHSEEVLSSAGEATTAALQPISEATPKTTKPLTEQEARAKY